MKFKNPFQKVTGELLNRCFRADIFCVDEQPEHVQLECGSELAGVVALALLDPSVEVDENSLATYLEDPDWWTDRLENDSPQTAFLVLNTRGEKSPGTPTEEEGFGLVPTERTGDDHELTFDSLGVMNNRNFWAAVNRRRNWKMVYLTAGRDSEGNFEAFFVENVSVYASINVQRSTKARKFYTGSAKWSTAMTPELPFYAPASIFTLNE
jgi:hypothetical protein